MQVKDKNGNIVVGLSRINNVLVVDDQQGFSKYKKNIQQTERIIKIENDIANLNNKIDLILNTLLQKE